ncbi:phosphoribosylanthranilate isomerase [Algoriphagus sp. H41]|uniref:phosphoribosylanthranilate isomerase n=1 Tax=Algoriphagus oliviformis TaxID=2811231 RepID=A0ABS3C4J3_9BACT|nr:phosphoribosylanthranilate isomerase [Algoriphagus oliviformis]MBN7812015.1 phosphoribosylanthranilate isomerase [Algoriphagus oliviformis]
MALKTFVKLNSVTNLTDARYGAGMYVNLLGFNLNETSENYVNPAQFQEITGWVSGVDFVGEFTHHNSPDLLEKLKAYPSITWIEYDRLEELQALAATDYSLIYKVALAEIRHIESEVAGLLSESNIVLHIFSEEETLAPRDLEVVTALAQNCKVILGTGITESNILDLIDQSGIYGISLSGGEEIKPGLKDMNELADILEKLETED